MLELLESQMTQEPLWLIAAGGIGMIIGNLMKGFFPFWERWLENTRLKEDYQKASKAKTLCREENEKLKETIAEVRTELSQLEGKIFMLKQFLQKDGYDDIEF